MHLVTLTRGVNKASYPSNWVVLFDSLAYDNLYNTQWLLRSNDGDSDGVSSIFFSEAS